METKTPQEELIFALVKQQKVERDEHLETVSTLKQQNEATTQFLQDLMSENHEDHKKELDSTQSQHRNTLKLTRLGYAVFGFFGGAAFGGIIATYAVWASENL